ncbi:Uncharacterized protein Rs2_04520 [Raphanus sativus]|nr:Uncharacterized protein Rs2_04520 [Raphanus sativus]
MLPGAEGVLSEARWLLDLGLLPNTSSDTRAIGYKQAMEYLSNVVDEWKSFLEQQNSSSSSGLSSNDSNRPATSKASRRDKFCCLSREDVIRFLVGVLGALAPLPLTSISSLGIINVDYNFIEASFPAMEAAKKPPCDPSASPYWNKLKKKNNSR